MRRKRCRHHISIFKTPRVVEARRVSRRISISLLLLSCFASADESALAPSDWVAVTDAVCVEEWRSDDRLRYCAAEGDFDGDNMADQARLIRGSKGKIGIALWLSSSSDRKPFAIFTPRKMSRQLQGGTALGIKRLSPGTYETTCGKGYGNCSAGEPNKVVIANDAILLFKDDSWGDVVYVDANHEIRLFAHSD